MTWAADLVKEIDARIETFFDDRLPFRAIVSAIDGTTGMVRIRRIDATTAETEYYARVEGLSISVSDEVLCVIVAGKPIIVGIIQRAEVITSSFAQGLTIASDSSSALLVEKADGTNSVRFLNSVTPGRLYLENSTELRFFTDTGSTGTLIVYGADGHIRNIGPTPSIAAGAAAGTTPTISITGTDRRGRITLTPGTTPATGVLATITFATTMLSSNYGVDLTQADGDAAGAITRVFPDSASRLNASWQLHVATSALTSGTQYLWFYEVEEYA